VFACRAALFISGQSQAASALIGSHMETCVYVSPNRETLMIEYPSEPALACGAASIMMDPENLNILLQSLTNALYGGVVEAGYRGEFVARILALLARDMVPNSVSYKPVTLGGFLTSFIGDLKLKELGLPQKFLEGLVTFTHFIPLKWEPTTEGLFYQLVSRFAAGSCRRNEKGSNYFFPVLLRDNTLGLVTFQVKNWATGDRKDITNASTTYLSPSYIFSGLKYTFTYVLGIYMQLGGAKEESFIPVWPHRTADYNNEYRLVTRGLSPKVFPFLTQKLQDLLKGLLTSFPDPMRISSESDYLFRILPCVYEPQI